MSELTLTFRPMAEMPDNVRQAFLRGGRVYAHGFPTNYSIIEAVRDPMGRWWAATGGDIEIIAAEEWATGLASGGTVSGQGGLVGEKPSERTSPPQGLTFSEAVKRSASARPDEPEDLGLVFSEGWMPPLGAKAEEPNWKRPTPHTDAAEEMRRRLLDTHVQRFGDSTGLSLYSQAALVIGSLQSVLQEAERARDNSLAVIRDLRAERKEAIRQARLDGLRNATRLMCDHCGRGTQATKDEDGLWWHVYIAEHEGGYRTARQYECGAGPIIAAIEAAEKEG